MSFSIRQSVSTCNKCLICGIHFHSIHSAILGNKDFRHEMDANFTEVAPICFQYERKSRRSARISQELREIFLSGPILNNNSLPGLNNVNKREYSQQQRQ